MIQCRPYIASDREACLGLFNANCPEFFAENERHDYDRFLMNDSLSYRVCFSTINKILGAYGLVVDLEKNCGRIRWIMADKKARGCGLGTYMMHQILEEATAQRIPFIKIAASQKSAPFFAKFGAVEHKITAEGWGSGLDRVDMELMLNKFRYY